VGDDRALAEIDKHRGVVARERGDLAEAETRFASAREVAESRQDLLLAAEIAREQAELAWIQRRSQETLQHLNRAHRLFTQLRAGRSLADIDGRMARLETSFLDIVRRWSESIESADLYTRGHCDRVAEYACALAAESGFDERTLFWFRMGAILHDVGKIVVPVEVLNKPGALTPDEREIIERHPVAGVEILADIDFPWDILPMVRHHHERWSGGGYPDALAGPAIPLSARILCVADVYDALTSARPYRAAYSHARAIEVMRSMAGTFDPELFDRFVRIADREPHWPIATATPAAIGPATFPLRLARSA
jgi:putative nucleotidyltransferase with HDIG domain